MSQIDIEVIEALRDLQREGHSVSTMFSELRKMLGGDPHIMDIISYFRKAFSLSLADTKPLGTLSGDEHRWITDEKLLEEFVMPKIKEHQHEWDN